jgi:hypothetical protein
MIGQRETCLPIHPDLSIQLGLKSYPPHAARGGRGDGAGPGRNQGDNVMSRKTSHSEIRKIETEFPNLFYLFRCGAIPWQETIELAEHARAYHLNRYELPDQWRKRRGVDDALRILLRGLRGEPVTADQLAMALAIAEHDAPIVDRWDTEQKTIRLEDSSWQRSLKSFVRRRSARRLPS